MTLRGRVVSFILSLMVAVTFVPMTGQIAFANEVQSSFVAGGKVAGLIQSGAAYNNVTIKWTAYAGANGYEVYRADKKNGKYKKIKTLTACSFKDKGNKKLGKKKYYKVRAYATVNSIKAYSGFSGILAAKPKVGTPSSLSTSGGAGKVTVKWGKVAGAKGYQVYRATSLNGTYTKVFTTKSRSYTNTSVTTGTKYFYKVRAFRKVKKKKKYGSFTSPKEGMAMLGGVGGLKATAAADGTVTNSWSKVRGASGYQLQRATSANGTYVTIGETTAASIKDKLTKSGQYFYRVRAYSIVNGKRQYGNYSAGGRTNALNQARSWVGCKESNGTHKKIIDIFNGYKPKCGAIGYRTAWCAAFVSAVAIKTNNTSIIPIDCYCPRMLSNFPKKEKSKYYTPTGGDVIFFDWNRNKVPDHVGMVEAVSGSSITTIEGNYSDAVKRRTFKKGYTYLLAYGIPNYSVGNVVSFTAPKTAAVDEVIAKADVTNNDIEEACDAITASGLNTEEPAAAAKPVAEPTAEEQATATEAAEEPAAEEPAEEPAATAEPAAEPAAEEQTVTTETGEEPVVEEPAEEPAAAAEPAAEPEGTVSEETPQTETETAEKIIEYIQEESPADSAATEESTYDAFLVYGICDEMDIEACVVTVTEADGSESSYNEVVLDGEMYILDASADGGVLEKYTPEEIN